MRKKILEKQISQLPTNVLWCKKCVISNQRPRIIFDENGICSGCKFNDYKNIVNWDEREDELLNLLNKYRRNDGNWDVIVPSSGGKDSGYVAHILKYKYNMNPLTVTWSPMKYTNVGRDNFDALTDSGLPNIKYTPNHKFQSKLARLCLEELGDAFHVFVLGQISYPFHMALKLGIKLVFYGENGEAEYAGDPKYFDKPFKPMSEWLNQYFKGTTFRDLLKYGVENKDYINENDYSESDLMYYEPPLIENLNKGGIEGKYFFSYYKKWIPQENYYYCAENTGFKTNFERSEGTYSKYSSLDDKFDGFHFYFRYIKLGLGRCSEDASHEIREGHISREEAISLMNKYEGEFPKKYFKEFIDYLAITEKQFWEIVDSWRSKNLWIKENDKWRLKNPV